MKGMKLKLNPVAIGLLALGLIVLVVSRLNVSVQVEPLSPDPTPSALEPTPSASPERISTPSPASLPTPTPLASSSAPSQTEASPSTTQSGKLRVSNQTDHPLRVALLPQQGTEEAGSTNTSNSRSYGEPVHWDFAPQEGGEKGLILSLPDGGLTLHDGDVLIAFAQDGSRRYWGPFVVGKTASPIWANDAKEWQLILQD